MRRIALFMTILERLCGAAERTLLAGPRTTKADVTPTRLSHALSYIGKNLASELREADLAQLTGQSVSAFSRAFHRQTGMPFVQYVNRLRIESACQMLLADDANITDICFQAGFNNVSNFNRQFRAVKGMASEFRALQRLNARSREPRCAAPTGNPLPPRVVTAGLPGSRRSQDDRGAAARLNFHTVSPSAIASPTSRGARSPTKSCTHNRRHRHDACIARFIPVARRPYGSDCRARRRGLAAAAVHAAPLRIGMTFQELNNPYFVTMQKALNDAAASIGAQVVVTDAHHDVSKQVSDVEDMLQKKIDILLVNRPIRPASSRRSRRRRRPARWWWPSMRTRTARSIRSSARRTTTRA